MAQEIDRMASLETKLDGLDTRMTRLETKLDTLADQWDKRVNSLQWLVGLGIAWMTAWTTIMVATGVAIVLKYGVT